MNTLNHLATGTILALAIDKPILVLPLALVSHFVLDSLPHFGYQGEEGYAEAFRHKLSYFSLTFDMVGICILLVLLGMQHWFALFAGFIAVLPDLMWVYRYFLFERKGLKPPSWKITNFHAGIQWCEREWGIIIEITYSVGALLLINRLI